MVHIDLLATETRLHKTGVFEVMIESGGFVVPDPHGIGSDIHSDSIGATSLISRMKDTTVTEGSERFRTGAAKYAAYLETPEGRLRLDLTFANLQDFLPQAVGSMRALDIGGGTGAIAVRLAQLGLHVTVLDTSTEMLGRAQLAAQKVGVTEKIDLKQGDATQLATLFSAGSFDLVLCHNVLEYVDDPVAVLTAAVRGLRGASSIISVLVRNQAGEVLKAAIQEGDLPGAERNLTAEWGNESLYGGRVRLFAAVNVRDMMSKTSLTLVAERGVRVLSDYLPPRISRNDEYKRILDLESKLGRRPEFAAVARYTHVIARRGGSTKDIP